MTTIAFIFSDPSVQEKQEDRVPTEIIAGVTCAIIVVLIIVVIFIGYRYRFVVAMRRLWHGDGGVGCWVGVCHLVMQINIIIMHILSLTW